MLRIGIFISKGARQLIVIGRDVQLRCRLTLEENAGWRNSTCPKCFIDCAETDVEAFQDFHRQAAGICRQNTIFSTCSGNVSIESTCSSGGTSKKFLATAQRWRASGYVGEIGTVSSTTSKRLWPGDVKRAEKHCPFC